MHPNLKTNMNLNTFSNTKTNSLPLGFNIFIYFLFLLTCHKLLYTMYKPEETKAITATQRHKPCQQRHKDVNINRVSKATKMSTSTVSAKPQRCQHQPCQQRQKDVNINRVSNARKVCCSHTNWPSHQLGRCRGGTNWHHVNIKRVTVTPIGHHVSKMCHSDAIGWP
jgi:hypothetical protein